MRQHVGLGFDVHRLEPGRRCVLGGVELDYPAGPAGHSDGDAVLHAIADALLSVSRLVTDHRDAIEELDINPLVVFPRGAKAVDALITTRPTSCSRWASGRT